MLPGLWQVNVTQSAPSRLPSPTSIVPTHPLTEPIGFFNFSPPPSKAVLAHAHPRAHRYFHQCNLVQQSFTRLMPRPHQTPSPTPPPPQPSTSVPTLFPFGAHFGTIKAVVALLHPLHVLPPPPTPPGFLCTGLTYASAAGCSLCTNTRISPAAFESWPQCAARKGSVVWHTRASQIL